MRISRPSRLWPLARQLSAVPLAGAGAVPILLLLLLLLELLARPAHGLHEELTLTNHLAPPPPATLEPLEPRNVAGRCSPGKARCGRTCSRWTIRPSVAAVQNTRRGAQSVFSRRNKRPVSRPGRKPALAITCGEHGALVDVGSVCGGVDALQLPPQQPAPRSAVVPLRAVDPDHATPQRSQGSKKKSSGSGRLPE